MKHGLDMRQAAEVATSLGCDYEKISTMAFLLKNLYECFIQRDALSITINPLIMTKEGRFVASNIKVDIDPDALYR